MRNYWNIGKFADWLRGTTSPNCGTGEEWKAWRKLAKTSHPIRYWIVEEGLGVLQDIWCYIPERINDVRYYLNNRFTTKTHALTSTLKRGQWHEFNERLLHCTFDSFVDFIEIDTAWSHCIWASEEVRAEYNMPWWRGQWWTRWLNEWRSPEAAIAHLEWEMTLKNTEWVEPTDPDYGKPTHQAIAAKEKWALYYWWKHVRPHRADVHDYCGWSAYCEERRLAVVANGGSDSDYLFCQDPPKDRERSRKISEAMRLLEKQYDDEDEEMLIRLIKLRDNLWT
jgi:hypothetical protein